MLGGLVTMPVIEQMLMMWPPPRARMPGSTALIMSTAPKKFVSKSAPDLGVVALLDRGQVAVAGVVDEHVDPAEGALGLARRPLDLGAVGDVERERRSRARDGRRRGPARSRGGGR